MWNKKCYKLAHSLIRMYIDRNNMSRAYSPKTHAVILFIGETCTLGSDERDMIVFMSESIWQAAKDAIRNRVMDDLLIRLKSKSDQYRLWFCGIHNDKPTKKRKIIRKIVKRYEE